MNQKYKKAGIIGGVLVILIVVLTFVSNSLIKRKIITTLNDLPKSIHIEYSTIDVAVWSGKIKLNAPEIMITGETTNKTVLNANLKAIEINNLSFWNLLVNDEIAVKNLEINDLVIKYLHNPLVKRGDNKSPIENIKQVVNVDKISIANAKIIVADFETDSTLLSMPKFNFELFQLQINPNSSEKNKVVTYDDFILNIEHLKWATNDYEDLFFDAMHMTKSDLQINGLKLKTKYSKAELSTLIKTERDHFNLNINEVELLDMDFGFNPANKFYFKSRKVDLDAPEFEIYRDKLIADDLTPKKLYSKMLRDLDFDLTLSEIELKNATIVYSEKVYADMPAGKLSFTKMNADIKNVSNTYGASEKTSLDIDAIFMAKTPIKVNWEFDVNNANDAFIFKADIGKLPAPDLNPFSQPNLKVQLEGELLHTYATISGDAITSRVNMRAKYEDFKVNILDKEGEKKNKVLSAIANLFIKKGSEEADDGFRESFKDDIERDKAKSIFNFLWLNLKAGLASVMTGDGKQ